MAKKIKRPSNNPNGRPELKDKKQLIGVYIRQSKVDEMGGPEAVRQKIKDLLGLTE